ncbi:uncharacterized protein PADG_06452 [Paracoccidioides brasiliensis Pb18]|uniref:Uncharacterized protein n=2 Tax=Paracoccidioides brasiliensis TaxID=121759 RepID=C1GGL5_PARBD|nr:uncharacterized protein PADG_06452 [Paracoccidioides brasiliensis Pb18]EEH50373.2 hypothetical protein PADG_06452 [Paracoccidioides brasiliensis Pb18]ODH14581.1 hypothetical protein ACO22_06553 [Paracoccidioides brasiliensis]ODH46356.1 hypothetical protein GX48_07547 [Paracoccidioides brasiliensis]
MPAQGRNPNAISRPPVSPHEAKKNAHNPRLVLSLLSRARCRSLFSPTVPPFPLKSAKDAVTRTGSEAELNGCQISWGILVASPRRVAFLRKHCLGLRVG